MFRSRVQDEIELQRRTARIFPNGRQDQPKATYPRAADRLGGNRADQRTPERAREAQHWLILDPEGNGVLQWNKAFLMSCLFALFVDPFFYYLPLVKVLGSNNSCIAQDNNLAVATTVLRSVADLFYMLNIVVKMHTAYVAPSLKVLGKGELVMDPRAIRRRYLRSHFFVDLLACLPLPQFFIWLVMPSIKSSNYNVKNTTLGVTVVFQYILRMYLVIPLSSQIVRAAGVVMKTAWGGAAYNLLLYMLASHITGAIYYLLTVERQITCWNKNCLLESNTTSCSTNFINCDNTGSDTYQTWVNSTTIFADCSNYSNTSTFNFGIFIDALQYQAVTTSFLDKYFYFLWWGLQQLSSSGNPLVTSIFITENIFAIAIGAISLILFAQLIGNMQTYLQSISRRREEWRLRQRDIEEWMRHHQLPDDLQDRVHRFVQVKWLANRGVEEENILQALPADIRREVQRHLCLDLVRRVPFFSEMDDQLLDAICERLMSFLCPEGTFISREGDPVNEMLFIIRGKLDSSTTNGGQSNFFNSILLRPGDFCGDELLTWALLPKTQVNLPLSTRTVRALTEVEAFALQAEDLKFVANQFRRLHSKKLQHTFRLYSHNWRTWAACFIQKAWRQHQRRKMAKELHRWEENDNGGAAAAAYRPATEGSDMQSSSSASAVESAILQMQKLASASRRFLSEQPSIPRLQKPDEPDFSADHFD